MILTRTWAFVAATILLSHLTWATPIFIQEVLYDPAGPDAQGAFTELAGPPGASLDGWSLVGVNGSTGAPYRTVALSGLIPADGIFVIATSRATAALAAERDLIANVDWQNGPDAIQLWDPFDVLIDALQYGDAGEHNAGEGRPAVDPDPGVSLSRDPRGRDTDDNATDFKPSEPTPGRVAATPLPAPSPLSLFLAGATAILLRRRTG